MDLDREIPLLSQQAILAMREALSTYLERLALRIDSSVRSGTSGELGGILGEPVDVGGRADLDLLAAAADGGSVVYSLSSASFGVAVAISLQLRVGGSVARGPARSEVVPEDPFEAVTLTPQEVDLVLSPLREAMVAEAALTAVRGGLGERPDLLILDGPLIPPKPVWLARRASGHSELAARAVSRYLEAHSRLIRASRKEGVTLVGFVKRPRAHYLSALAGVEEAALSDSAVASEVLRRVGQMAPGEPITLREGELELMLGGEARSSIEPGSISFAFLRTSRRRPPYRVDFGPIHEPFGGPADVASYLVATADADGIPIAVVKADESVKVTRRVARDAYLESMRRMLARAPDARRVLQLLTPMYGE